MFFSVLGAAHTLGEGLRSVLASILGEVGTSVLGEFAVGSSNTGSGETGGEKVLLWLLLRFRFFREPLRGVDCRRDLHSHRIADTCTESHSKR